MKRIKTVSHIRTPSHIRTSLSIPASTGSRHNRRWSQLRETEQLQAKEKRLPALIRRIWRQ
jgi:hypothetical protein